MSKNLNVSATPTTATKLSAIQDAITNIREAAGVSRKANQTDAVNWAIQNTPLPTKQTYQVLA